MTTFGRTLRPLALVLMLSGCAAQKAYKTGATYALLGMDYAAAEQYLEALDINQDHRKSAEALVLVAENAYHEKHEIAWTYESEKNYATALFEYQELLDFTRKLKSWNALGFATMDLVGKIEEMASSAAEAEYARAEGAFIGGEWEMAIARYNSAQSFKAGYKDSRTKTATAYYRWAEEDLGERRYRTAAKHFAAAGKAMGGAFEDAAVRAAGLYASLGSHFIRTGACRQAVRDLRTARKLHGSETVGELLTEAEDCSVTPVAVLPFENPTGRNVAGMALGDTIAQAVEAKVKGGASEFVRLVERGALEAILAEQGLSAGGLASGSTGRLQGVRYLVVGKLTQVLVEDSGISTTSGSGSAREFYDCVKTRKDGTKYDARCQRVVMVNYQDHQGRRAVRVAGSVKVIDIATGAQLATDAFDQVSEDAVHWVDGFEIGTRSVTLEHIATTGEFKKLSEARRQLKGEGELASALVTALATRAGKVVLGAVDVENEAVDPAELELVELH